MRYSQNQIVRFILGHPLLDLIRNLFRILNGRRAAYLHRVFFILWTLQQLPCRRCEPDDEATTKQQHAGVLRDVQRENQLKPNHGGRQILNWIYLKYVSL